MRRAGAVASFVAAVIAACSDGGGRPGQRGSPSDAGDDAVASGARRASGGAPSSGGATSAGGAGRSSSGAPSSTAGTAATGRADSGKEPPETGSSPGPVEAGATGASSTDAGVSLPDAGSDYTGPPGFEPHLIPPDASYDTAAASLTVNGVEFIDPSGALTNLNVQVDSVDPAALVPALPGVEVSYSFEPSGPLADVVYVRIPLAASRQAGSDLEWWTLDATAQRWFLQSIGRVAVDGAHAVFALDHFSPQAVVASPLNVPPLYTQTVSGSCEGFARATVKGVTDAEGTLRAGDCGYTKFLPTFSGLEQTDFMNDVASGKLPPPFKLELTTASGADPSVRFCARAYAFDIDVGATVEVSALDWTEGSQANSACGREMRRLHQVIVDHEAKHVADALPVVDDAQRALARLDVSRCAASSSDAQNALVTPIQQALSAWLAGIMSDWDARQKALDSSGGDTCQIDCTKCDPCDPRTNAKDFSKCRYAGNGSSTASSTSSNANVTWAYTGLNGPLEVILSPSGQISLSVVEPAGCTVAPLTHTIVASDGNLHLSYATDPPVYWGGGVSTWPGTLTCTINGQTGGGSTSLTSGWFWPDQSAKMPFTAPTPLSGSRTVSDVTGTWNFALY